MRKFTVVSIMLITLCIIENTVGAVSTPGTKTSDSTDGTKSSDSTDGKKTSDSTDGKKTSDSTDGKKTSDSTDGKKTSDCADTKESGTNEFEESAEKKDAEEIMHRMSTEVVEVDEVDHKCDNDNHGHDHDHSKSEQQCSQDKVPTTPNTKEEEEAPIGVSPKPRMIRNGNGIVFKYEVDFARPIFNMKGFRGGLAAGYITPKTNTEIFDHSTVYTNGTIKLFLSGEFGFVRKDNSTFGVVGEVSLEIRRGNGEISVGAAVKVTMPGKNIKMEKSIGNYMKESPPLCVTIPQLAGIRFCQVAFDFIFRTNFTGSACIQTEIKHLACPIPLVTIQYHCINFSRQKLFITKTTRKSGVVNPKEVFSSFTKRIPSPKTNDGKQGQPPSSTKTSNQNQNSLPQTTSKKL